MPPFSSACRGLSDARLRTAGSVFGFAVFSVILFHLWRLVSEGQLALDRADQALLGAAMVLLMAAYAAQALAWHLLVRAAGSTASLRTNFGCWALSLLGKYVPGKVFHAMGRLVLYRNRPPGPAGASAALVTELLLTLTAAACVATLALAQNPGLLPFMTVPIAAVSAALGITLSFFTSFDRAAGRIAARALKAAAPARIAVRLRLLPFGLQAVSYMLLGIGLHLLARAWNMSEAAPPAIAIGALCLSGLAGVIAFVVPAGIGVRDGALVWLLAPFGGMTQAVFIAVAARVWLTAGDALAAAVGGWLLTRGDGHRG